MGEAVVSNEEERRVVNEDEKSKRKEEEDSSLMIKLEKYLPNISVRVLVVESDDSTRQIVGALLRKCSYKVASVSDGLQAWEVLKARPHNIDLILTEVDLPSISGFALLSLIMEHEICKNIPVIMMSTNDSVSTVYKCMLKGAADFLVKPIRTNELKNLWQHVWRRQSMNQQGFGQLDESVGQQKLEATAENNDTSDNSLSYRSFAPKQDEGVKKGSDAQSSCGKRDLEAESGSLAEVQNQSQPMHTELTAFGSITNSQKTILCPESQVSGSHALGDVNHTEVGGSKGSFHNSSREAIDLIGALRNNSRPYFYTNDGSNKFEFCPELDLSLKRFHSDVVPEDKTSYEKQMLNHSNASAFTTYVNKPQQLSNWNVTSVYTSKEQVNTTGDHTSENASGRNINTKNSPLPYERKVISLPINPTKDIENGQQNASSQRLFPIPFPVRGVRVDVCATPSGRGSTNPNTVHTSSPSRSPSSTNQQPNSYMGENGGGNVYLDAENGNDQGCLSRQRSVQREAALNKFRLKRKERCFEKKVRYESRKKLAEQRPRVKGQFVRQVPPDPPPKTGHCCGSLVAN